MALGVTVTDMRTIRETGWPIGLLCFFYSILRGVLSTVSTLASIPAGTDQAKRSKIAAFDQLFLTHMQCRFGAHVSRRSNYARQTIDCVVVEIDLPDMSGFQVLASLVPRASRPETAVVVYTSLPNPYLSELALKNGARAALRKIAPVTNLLDRSILDAISRVKKDRERFNGQRLSFIL